MRFGNWRGVTLALALVSAIMAGSAGKARADLFHTIPREVEAVDVNTGGPYMAPPVPYGHYAKGGICSAVLSPITSLCGRLGGLLNGCCGGCHDKNCGHCSDGGCGHCGKGGHFGDHCGKGGDPGCGHGLFGHGGGLCGNGGGLCGNGGGLCGKGMPCASSQSAPQTVLPSPQVTCGERGCGLKARHFHRLGKGCTLCGGNGCGTCQDPGLSSGSVCGGCNGNGCGLCGGRGLFGHGGNGCNACGGRGCNLCSAAKGILGLPHAIVNKLLHKGEIEYFVGPGGPVPLTPGYVPYVVATRSPRDFFAFPPFMP